MVQYSTLSPWGGGRLYLTAELYSYKAQLPLNMIWWQYLYYITLLPVVKTLFYVPIKGSQ